MDILSKTVKVTQAPGFQNEIWAALTIKELIRHNIRGFCVAPGARNAPLVLAAADHPLAQVISHFDERGLGFYALGQAKGSRMGVAIIVTSGTAVGNLFPAVMEASAQRVPLVVLSADRPPELRQCGAHQTADQVKMFGKYVKWDVDIPVPSAEVAENYLSSTIAYAVYQAKAHPQGPVHLNCMLRKPLHCQTKSFSASTYLSCQEKQASTFYHPSTCQLDQETMQYLAHEWSCHEKGIIIVGELSVAEYDLSVFALLAEKLNWPLFVDPLSQLRGKKDENTHTLAYYTPLLQSTSSHDLRPEVIVHFGNRPVSQKLQDFCKKANSRKYFHIAPHDHRQDPDCVVSNRIICGEKQCCQQLLPHLPSKTRTHWIEKWHRLSQSTSDKLNTFFAAQKKLSEPYLFHALASKASAKMAFFIGNSMPIRDADSFFFPLQNTGPLFSNRGLSGIDGNVATAIGVSKGIDSPVVAILGDLTFLHDINSLALLQKNPHPMIFIVLNNQGGGIFSFLPLPSKEKVFEDCIALDHPFDFKSVSTLFHLDYHKPESQSAFAKAFDTSLESQKSAIIEVTTNRQENYHLHQEITDLLKERKTKQDKDIVRKIALFCSGTSAQ